MKKLYALIALVVVVVFASCSTSSQGTTSGSSSQDARNQKRAEQKQEEAEYDEANYQIAMKALTDKEFVLEADQLMSRFGRVLYVNSTTNFVMVNKDKATVQIAANNFIAGPNGVGGITVDGTVSDVKTKIDKKGNVDFSFAVQGIGISAQVYITMTHGSNTAQATVYPNFNSNNVTLSGNIVTLGETSTFKGRTIF